MTNFRFLMTFKYIPIVALVLLAGSGAAAQSQLPACPTGANAVFDTCFGAVTYPMGGKYVGEFRNDKENGMGTFTFPDGRKFVGAFRDGDFTAKGVFSFPNGEKYVGEFREGRFNGEGTYTYADGSFFVGEQFGGEPLRLGFGLGVGGKIHKKMGPCACHAHGVGGGGQSSSGIITVMAGSGLSMSSGPHWAINFTSLAR